MKTHQVKKEKEREEGVGRNSLYRGVGSPVINNFIVASNYRIVAIANCGFVLYGCISVQLQHLIPARHNNEQKLQYNVNISCILIVICKLKLVK